MILYIDTTNNKEIIVALKAGAQIVGRLTEPAERAQAERLLPAIERLLADNQLKLTDLTAVDVNNHGGSFTSLRIGVVTANALAFALGIPVHGIHEDDEKRRGGIALVEPKYSTDPQITSKKKKPL